ncbi:IclR family transcriptional regulator [Aeromicrobium sp. Root472D3]|uniref:IclR family transcriptional regulator n=1 Tax=Aeromicrobium sp. Root472D3 TaxID=1736540 RepID=UPI0006FDC97D|nr:IclR family transcriptional regulator [Aeromicrobium sp. Root472D3]KQX75100.1 IclR family transcriptional regulator [Aeromicrobium sp. Root472D3]
MSRGQGIEVVARVGALLRGVGTHEPGGVSTTDAAREVVMARPTAHRLLTSLAREGLVDRDPRTGLWHLGPELYLLGTSAASRYDISHHARAVVHELAAETGESAFLSARRGDETVCLLSEDGSFPLRSHVLREGIRFPLGVASAGLAILAHLPERELQAFLAGAGADLAPAWGDAHAVEALTDRVHETRTAGFATNPGLVVEGSWGMGAAVFDRSGSPAWALSLTGVESRFRDDRRVELGRLLLDRAHQLTQLLRSSPV